ncbi:helix-turn-helix transcriptional regulator [Paraburkholderia acidipaludis]|uniref:helix-turn-helix transcriptional regulator n=1 Tax=Paraburkholderia acidipaludis TaxID=660537 RepID=UPI00146FA18E
MLLTVDQFAQVASCGRQAVYKMIERGFGPAVLRYGEKTLRFRVQDVRDWIKKQTVPIVAPTSEQTERAVAPTRQGRPRERDRRKS